MTQKIRIINMTWKEFIPAFLKLIPILFIGSVFVGMGLFYGGLVMFTILNNASHWVH